MGLAEGLSLDSFPNPSQALLHLLSKAHGQTDEIRRTMDELKGELEQLMDSGKRSSSIG
jgi:hypothetical protein